MKYETVIRMIFFVIAVLVIFIVVDISYNVKHIQNKFEQKNNQYKEYLNKDIILFSDTLKVIEYSILRETFTLSNGIEVNEKVVFKNLAKD